MDNGVQFVIKNGWDMGFYHAIVVSFNRQNQEECEERM